MPKGKTSRAVYTRKQVQERMGRQQEFLDHLERTGDTFKAACEALGMSIHTYYDWRNRFPEFLAKAQTARTRGRKGVREYDGSFIGFRKAYLRMESTWFQQMIAEAIESAKPGEVVLVLIPPGHGKTTLLEDWCTYKLCTNPNFRITVGSETVDHCVKVSDRVRMRLEPDGPTPKIAEDFGPLAPETGRDQVWGQRHFNVAQKRQSDERDYSMNTVGLTGRVQGTRCDLLLLDDMQDVKSIDQSEKFSNITTQSFLSRPEMVGRTVIIGTRVGEFDVYRMLMDNEIPDRVIRIPAYDTLNSPVWERPEKKPKMDDPSTWAPEGVKFLWPEKYNQLEEGGAHMEGLERFRYASLRFRVKEQTWWRIYMQRPEAASSMTFDEDTTQRMRDETRSWLGQPRPITRADDDENVLEKWDERKERPVPIIIGVDPAIGGGNGIMSVAARPKCMDVLTAHLRYDLSTYSQIIDLIEEDCARFTTRDSVVTTVVVEDKAFQKGLMKDERMLQLQKRYGFRLVPNTTGREKTDPDFGVPSLESAMVREEITIPWADERSQHEMQPLLDQLHQWRPGVNGVKLPQDLVMTLWFCFRQWRSLRNTPIWEAPQLGGWRTSPSPLRVGRTSRPRRTISSSYRRVARGRY